MPPLIRWIDEADATGEVAAVYDRFKAKNPGRADVPQILKCFSARPDFMAQVLDFAYTLHFSDGHLTRRQKELIATYVSGLNGCGYCRGSHAGFLDREIGPAAAAAVAAGDLTALPAPAVTPAETELLRFAGEVARRDRPADPRDLNRLRAAGWSDAQIAEAVYTTAIFTFYNQVANAFGLEDPTTCPPQRTAEANNLRRDRRAGG